MVRMGCGQTVVAGTGRGPAPEPSSSRPVARHHGEERPVRPDRHCAATMSTPSPGEEPGAHGLFIQKHGPRMRRSPDAPRSVRTPVWAPSATRTSDGRGMAPAHAARPRGNPPPIHGASVRHRPQATAPIPSSGWDTVRAAMVGRFMCQSWDHREKQPPHGTPASAGMRPCRIGPTYRHVIRPVDNPPNGSDGTRTRTMAVRGNVYTSRRPV